MDKKRKSLTLQLREIKQNLYSSEQNYEDLLRAHHKDVDTIKVKNVAIDKLVLEKTGLEEMLNDSQAMTGRLLMQLAEGKCKADLENIPLHVKNWSPTMSVGSPINEKNKDE